MSLMDKTLWALGSERRKGWVVERLSELTIKEGAEGELAAMGAEWRLSGMELLLDLGGSGPPDFFFKKIYIYIIYYF